MLIASLITFIILFAQLVLGIYLVYLLIRSLRIYIQKNNGSHENKILLASLGENIRKYRTDKNMTQEFLAESLGDTRQSISKWETGSSDPSTTNLIALARVLEVEVKDLLNY